MDTALLAVVTGDATGGAGVAVNGGDVDAVVGTQGLSRARRDAFTRRVDDSAVCASLSETRACLSLHGLLGGRLPHQPLRVSDRKLPIADTPANIFRGRAQRETQH